MLDFSLDLRVKNDFPPVTAVYTAKKLTILLAIPIILPISPRIVKNFS